MGKVRVTISGEQIPPSALQRIGLFMGVLAADYSLQSSLEFIGLETPVGHENFSRQDFEDFNAHSNYAKGTASRVRGAILRAAWGWAKSDDSRLQALGETVEALHNESYHSSLLPASALREIVACYGTPQELGLRSVGATGIGFLRDFLMTHQSTEDPAS